MSKAIIANIDLIQLQSDVTTLQNEVNATQSRTINVTFDGGGSALTAGLSTDLEIPYVATIQSWNILSGLTGSIVIDVLKSDSYSTYPTFSSIAGSEKPTLSSQQKNQDTNLSTWTTGLTASNILRFNIDSATTVQKVFLTLKINLA